MHHEELSRRTFEFSCKMMELYTQLIRSNELELAARVLKYGLSIRKNTENAAASFSQIDFTESITVASDMAIQTRYWLKLVQIKCPLLTENDACVESLNAIINSLNYIITHSNQYHVQLQYQVN
jgi:four helix bundle protein